MKDVRFTNRATVSVAACLAATVLLSAGAASAQKGLCEDVDLDKAKAGDLAATVAAAEAAYKLRKDEAKLREAIAKWKEATEIAPKKPEAYLALARATYFLGDGILRLAGKDKEMIQTLEESVYWTERALRVQNPDYQFSVCAQEPFMEKTIKTIRKQDIPYVYWYATTLGKWGLAKSIIKVLDNREKIYGIMMKVRQMDPEYWYGAADRYLGGYFTKIPFPKGDLKKSQAHFEASLKRSPNYLTTHVLIAEMLATKLRDRDMFKKHVDFVLAAKEDIIPGLEAEAAIEKQKAKRLLDDIDALVPGK